MPTHSVYALCDPRTGEIRYIGQALDIHKRYAQHLFNKENNRAKVAWLNELKHIDKIPTLIVIEKDIEKCDICHREMYWIAYYMLHGADLLNITVPGRAPNGHGKPNPQKALIVKSVQKAPIIPSAAQPITIRVIEAPLPTEVRVYTLAEVAKRFDVKESGIKRHIKRGEMNASIGPNGLIVTQEDLDNFLLWARTTAAQEIDERLRRRRERQQSAG